MKPTDLNNKNSTDKINPTSDRAENAIAILDDFSKNIFNGSPPESKVVLPVSKESIPLAAKPVTNDKDQGSTSPLVDPLPSPTDNLLDAQDPLAILEQEVDVPESNASLHEQAAPVEPQVERHIVKPLPDILAGRYKLERLLGVGGMCVVYRAYDILGGYFGNPKPYVALKTFTEEFAEYADAGRLLYSEYALTAKLSHPNIIKVYQFDVDAESERAFITLELLKGITLEQWLIEHPLGIIWNKAKPIIFPLLEMLEHSHKKGILHGDLKPSNVMLTDEGCKLFDYGLGQAVSGDMAKLPKIARERFNAWTPRYAAPELIKATSLTKKTDIFALSCIIYELLTGKNPYYQDNSQEIVNTPKRPKTLSKPAWKALKRGLELDPEKRTITVTEMKKVFSAPKKIFGLF